MRETNACLSRNISVISLSALNGSSSMKRFGSSSFHKDYEPVTHGETNGATGRPGQTQETYDIPVGGLLGWTLSLGQGRRGLKFARTPLPKAKFA